MIEPITHSFLDADMWIAWSVGVLGLMASLLTQYAKPKTDNAIEAFRILRKEHSLSALLAAIAYSLACVVLHEAGQLTVAAGIGIAYMTQDGVSKILTRRARRNGT